jgi:hypothetical protein
MQASASASRSVVKAYGLSTLIIVLKRQRHGLQARSGELFRR